MMTSPGPSRCAVGGLALVAVLWMVAALSLIATGLAAATRIELRTVTQQRSMLEAALTGDAAIAIALRDAATDNERQSQWRSVVVNFEEQVIIVDITPLTGLVDLNHAPVTLLAELFASAGALEPGAAEILASELDAQRTAPLNVSEDLLQLSGVAYELYAKISSLITVEGAADGKVNPLSAPVSVLRLLARGDEQLSIQYADARQSQGPLADTTRFSSQHSGNASGQKLRIQAYVPLGDAVLVRSRHVQIGKPSTGGAPWSTFRIDTTMMPDAGAGKDR